MQKTEKTYHSNKKEQALSNLIIDEKGNLSYKQLPRKIIYRTMLKDFPIMAWYLLAGMVLLLARTLWALTHSEYTVTSKADWLVYYFLLFMSVVVISGLLGGSYYFAKVKLKQN